MAEFLTTNGITTAIEQILIKAQKKVCLISPYLQIPDRIFDRVEDAVSRNVEVTIIYGKGELISNEFRRLYSLPDIKIFYIGNLHAKCYFNENKLIISTMNLYEFSEKHNWEMGVLADRLLDAELYSNAVMEAEVIRSKAEDRSPAKSGIAENQWGYCINCHAHIELNPDRPYCKECYQDWSRYSNPFYLESNCHCCGKREKTSMEKPLCYSCYIQWQALIHRNM
jgi:hypothetical protein